MILPNNCHSFARPFVSVKFYKIEHTYRNLKEKSGIQMDHVRKASIWCNSQVNIVDTNLITHVFTNHNVNQYE